MAGKTVLEEAPLPPVHGTAVPPIPDDLGFLPGVPEEFTPLANLPNTMNINYKKWLESEMKWEARVGKGWVPKRVLGTGGFGIVGHWAYEGLDKDLKSVTNVAVKQQLRSAGFTLNQEAAFYQWFRDSNTQHIPKVYRTVYTEQGKGTNLREYDTFGIVDRMFMEFCEGGDLSDWLKDRKQRNRDTNGAIAADLSTLELWEIFHCLVCLLFYVEKFHLLTPNAKALALLVMHTGSEKYDGSVARWDKPEIAHLDLKLENVFLGSKTRDEEHFNKPPAKIGDFGLAIEIPRGAAQGPDFLKKHSGRGTTVYLAPEQVPKRSLDPQLLVSRPWHSTRGAEPRNRHYGTVTNVWQVGMIMHCLIHTRYWPNFDYPTEPDILRCAHFADATEGLQAGGFTVCVANDMLLHKNRHKKPFLERHARVLYLVLECLLIEPDARPHVKDLAKLTREGLDNERAYLKELKKEENKQKAKEEREARRKRGEDIDGVLTDDDFEDFLPGPPHEEPLLSAQWYVGQQNPPVKQTRVASAKTAQELARLRKEQYRKLREQNDPQIKQHADAVEERRRRLDARVVPPNLLNPKRPAPTIPPQQGRPAQARRVGAPNIVQAGIPPVGAEGPPQQGAPAQIPAIPQAGVRPPELQQQPVLGPAAPNNDPIQIQGQNPPPPGAPSNLSPNAPHQAPYPPPYPQERELDRNPRPQDFNPNPNPNPAPPPQQVPPRPAPSRAGAPPPTVRRANPVAQGFPRQPSGQVNLTFACQASRRMLEFRAPPLVAVALNGLRLDSNLVAVARLLGGHRTGIQLTDMNFYTGTKHWRFSSKLSDVVDYMRRHNIYTIHVYDKRI